MFEIGPVFLPLDGQLLPQEAGRLSIGMTGQWDIPSWQTTDQSVMDFFSLKGIVEGLLQGLHIQNVSFEPADHPTFHPGRCADVMSGDKKLGTLGEVHPAVRKNYNFPITPVLAAEFDLDQVIALANLYFDNKPISSFPAVYEDIAVIVDETIPAASLKQTIIQAGGKLLNSVRLFDVYRDPKIGEGKRSMAYQLTYQAADRTLTDKDAEAIRNRIVRALKNQFGAILRSQ
jgi:phenylalanyl-tRNA synthetase beta chain